MVKTIKEVTVAVPHRISGFFEIVDKIRGEKISNPEQIGSTGAGFNLSALGITSVSYKELESNDKINCKISINNKEVNEQAETTYYIFNYIKSFLKAPVEITIDHHFDLPVGCGYGASGSGALGAIIGLNRLLRLELNYFERGRIAHISEVVNKTGLGTVCGQLGGGLCILKKPGYPCVHEKIATSNSLNILCGSFGMIHTKSILSDPILSSKIKEAGKRALTKLKLNPTVKTFIDASIEFVYDTEILDILELENIKELIETLNKLDIIGASMNQLGRSVYAFCNNKDKRKVFEIFESYMPEIKIFDLKINKKSPFIMKSK